MTISKTLGAFAGVLAIGAVAFLPAVSLAHRDHDRDRWEGPLVCEPGYQEVERGEIAEFHAEGGWGHYRWVVGDRTFNNDDASLRVGMNEEGWQMVVVISENETAYCNILVTDEDRRHGYYGPRPSFPAYPPVPPTPSYTAPGVYVGATYYPALPNTGFAPTSLPAVAAFATVLFVAAGVVIYPYVRKTLTTAVR